MGVRYTICHWAINRTDSQNSLSTTLDILLHCCWFAYFPLTNLVPTVKDFVKFLKEHPSAFAFSSQDHPFSEPPEPL